MGAGAWYTIRAGPFRCRLTPVAVLRALFARPCLEEQRIAALLASLTNLVDHPLIDASLAFCRTFVTLVALSIVAPLTFRRPRIVPLAGGTSAASDFTIGVLDSIQVVFTLVTATGPATLLT